MRLCRTWSLLAATAAASCLTGETTCELADRGGTARGTWTMSRVR